MTITRHPFCDEADIPRILDLVHTMPVISRHTIDLPWRLASPIIYEGCDASFWKDANGQVIGFAAWQYHWAVLDFFILPGPSQQEVETEIFAWAEERMHERDEERGKPLLYWVDFRDDDHTRRQLVEAHGFLLAERDYYALFQHALNDLPPVPTLPDSFVLRTLAGEQETAAYSELHRAAFESTSMTPEWRARTLRMPQYRSDLDLVITAPDGSLAAFCVGWFEPVHKFAQIEPIGVHPHFQRRGLGRVLLLEMLHRFRAYGVASAFIEPSIDNAAIHRVCEIVGFKLMHTIRRKGKWVENSSRLRS